MNCHDCGKQIYDDAADENIGCKHAAVYCAPVVFFVCMDCSMAYEDITHEVLGEIYAPIGDDTKPKNKDKP